MNAQREALRKIKASGSVEGINSRTVAVLERRGNIKGTADGWILTKRGESRLAGRLGNAANLTRMWEGKEREATLKAAKKGGKGIKATRATLEQRRAKAKKEMQTESQRAGARESKALASVLGPTGKANAVKIAREDGGIFTFHDVDAFEALGWKVEGAGSVSARPGAAALRGVAPLHFNPAPLGPNGTARALVLIGPINRETVMGLRRDGFDVTSAPKRLKTVKNPGGYGSHRDLERAAERKAADWYQDDSLVTKAKPLRGYEAPNAAIEVGDMVAIEYSSKKFDGVTKTYRHEATKKRKMLISLDGSTIIVWPPFKVTKRGIEG